MSAPQPGEAEEPGAPGRDRPTRGARDRRGRGMRGPAVLSPDPGLPGLPGLPRPGPPTGRDRFDGVVLAVAADLEARWGDRLAGVEYAVEDTPRLPDDWRGTTVPLSALVRPAGGRPARVVVFRRPVEHRAEGRAELEALVLGVVVEQVAELLGLDPDEVDPRVADDDP